MWRCLKGQNWFHVKLSGQKNSMKTEAFQLFKEWNQKINLTAIIEDEDIVLKHFIDSLTCLKAIQLRDGMQIADIGTGAGFPGIPLKIYCPGIKLTLIESVKKKTLFLDDLIGKLGLKDVEVLAQRAEALAADHRFQEKFDIILSRATGKLLQLTEWSLPLLKRGGMLLAQKGKDISNEIEALIPELNVLNINLQPRIFFDLPHGAGKRALIIVQKNN
jgi:16S rRNA (guanine527-N7)-methyltransferase